MNEREVLELKSLREDLQALRTTVAALQRQIAQLDTAVAALIFERNLRFEQIVALEAGYQH